MQNAYGMKATSDLAISRDTAIAGDLKFKRAMLRARELGLEHFTVGVDARPGTELPVFTPHRALPIVRNGSPGSLCSDLGDPGTRGTHTSYAS